ncbi:serine protease [Chryseobacterium sp.]|uniref:S1 family peptidase n=1 Tax=Chryseobacterium sp. TaxID=1871047 RepID=UPI002899F4D1|nr:serine protease [Chryseobacterium sp.]
MAIGTGFIVKLRNYDNYLVTNWHCVTGMNPETGKALSKSGHTNPEILNIHFLMKGKTDQWVQKRIKLIDENFNPTYLMHPKGNVIDVVAIKLPIFEDVEYYNIWDAVLKVRFDKEITDTCSIVGFPKGISTSGKLPIWKTGHIASEIEVNHDDKPQFLIDASTREGMSGSPVYCVKLGIISVNGAYFTGAGTAINFLGIYAGRLGNDIEIGRVFKEECLLEIFEYHLDVNNFPKQNQFNYIYKQSPN